MKKKTTYKLAKLAPEDFFQELCNLLDRADVAYLGGTSQSAWLAFQDEAGVCHEFTYSKVAGKKKRELSVETTRESSKTYTASN